MSNQMGMFVVISWNSCNHKKNIFTRNTSMATVIHEDDKVAAEIGTEYLIQGLSMHELFLQA